MKTAIIYYSKHHENTKKILDALKADDPSLELVDIVKQKDFDASSYDRIGLASGIYFANYAKQMLEYIENHLPENKDIFYIFTHGSPLIVFPRKVHKLVKNKHCREIGKYHSRGYDTYVFKRLGGIAKKHPNDKDFTKAIKFYKKLK